jgi:hypothetical protein
MWRDGGVILKIGAVIMNKIGPGADDGVLLSLNVMVLDAVLELSVDIAKMVSLIFFLEFCPNPCIQ